MQLTCTVESAEFARSVRSYLDTLRVNQKALVCNQAMLLTRTLISFTPPQKKSQTTKKITKSVKRVFGEGRKVPLTDNAFRRSTTNKTGLSDVYWYDFKSDVVRGIKDGYDLTTRSNDEIKQWYLTLKNSVKGRGRMFRGGNRGKQNFRYWMKFTITEQQLEAIKERLYGAVGRLKAGWLPAWIELKKKTSAHLHGRIPDWITKHSSGAKGRIALQLSDGRPSIDLVNFGTGARLMIENRNGLASLVSRAIKTRALAMREDIKFALAEPQKWILRKGNEAYWTTDPNVIDV